MKIHPSLMEHIKPIPVGDAVSCLPNESFMQDIVEIRVSVSASDKAWPPFTSELEFVRFLTERNGQRIHVWKRTK